MMCNIYVNITIIFSLLFPYYYHCTYNPTTITHTDITLTIVRMMVIIMEMIAIIFFKKSLKQMREKAKQIKSYDHFSFGPKTERRTGLTNRQRYESSQCESVPHSHLSLRNKQVKCYTDMSEVLQQRLPQCFNTAAERDE